MKEKMFKKMHKTLIEKCAPNVPRIVTRGFIIAWFTNVEDCISSILAEYYVKKKCVDNFIKNFLFDESCTFGLKLKVFFKLKLHEKVKNSKKFEQDLRRINEIRNIVAHSIDVYSKSETLIFHSKKRKPVDITKLHEEFLQIYWEIMPELDKISKQINN